MNDLRSIVLPSLFDVTAMQCFASHGNRSGIGQAGPAAPVNSTSDVTGKYAGANLYGAYKHVLMPERHNSWTVLARPDVLRQRRYRGTYKRKFLRLPLALSFQSARYDA
jgi:hypothetical protein